MIYINIVMCLIVLNIVTFLCGITMKAIMKDSTKSFSEIYVLGFLSEMVIFGLLSVPLELIAAKFTILYYLYIFAIIGFILLGAAIFGKRYMHVVRTILQKAWSDKSIMLVISMVLIVIQIIFSLSYISGAADDQFYQGISWQAVYHNQILTDISSYTGWHLTTYSIDSSRFCATYPIWIAVLSKLFVMNPTIVYHMVMTIYIIPLSYMSYAILGKLLLNDEEKIHLFLAFIALLYIFGARSEYAISYYSIASPWYGKIIAGTVILPLVICYAAKAMGDKHDNIMNWVKLLVCMIAITVLSAMVSVLSVLAFSAIAGYYLLKNRKWKDALWSVTAYVPAGLSFLIGKLAQYIIK